jgi:DNA-directed RNA polymerase specialized sigma24 family protein
MAANAADGRMSWTREVTSALAALTRQEQTFIRLSYADGLRHDDIAEQAGVSALEVSTVMAAGMRRLALVLEQNYLSTAPVHAMRCASAESRRAAS